MMGKTLKELNVQPGDVVEWISQPDFGHMTVISAKNFEARGVRVVLSKHGPGIFIHEKFRIISRASDTPKLWRDMTAEEKGALLLAHHEKKGIDFWNDGEWDESSPAWHPDNAYRIRPEPKVETVTFYWNLGQSAFTTKGVASTHRITFNLIDGKPGCDSVKMEKL